MLAALLPSLAVGTSAFAYDKAVESNEVVLNKLFPKKGKTELDMKLGVVLNSSYTQTFLANGGISYFWSEEWGFNVEASYAIVSDKNERKCVETFYNDPNFAVADECGEDPPDDPDGDANWGPAYVPIRQLKYMFTANAVWNPVYGKQIILLSATNYFDFYLLMGGGIAMSDFYPKQTTIGDTDTSSRNGSFCVKKEAAPNKPGGCDPSTNPGTTDDQYIGESGRPAPQSETNVLMHLAVGQRFHFLKRFVVNASLDNYTLLGTEAGFDNFLTLMGGVGVRF
jgi:outer membrane beta-barrel protein